MPRWREVALQPATEEISFLLHFIAPEILGRPTDSSVTINVVPAIAMEIYYEYGTAPGTIPPEPLRRRPAAGVPLETLIDGLQPDTRVYYRIRYWRRSRAGAHLRDPARAGQHVHV